MNNSNTVEVIEVVAKSKMDVARELFKAVNTRGYDLQGKTQRGAFIVLAEQAGLSKHCAGTYYQNLSNQARGGKLYGYNKPAKKPTKDDVKAAEAQVMTDLGKHRWMIVDQDGKEVNSFESRAKAQEAAKEVNGKWMDRTKAA